MRRLIYVIFALLATPVAAQNSTTPTFQSLTTTGNATIGGVITGSSTPTGSTNTSTLADLFARQYYCPLSVGLAACVADAPGGSTIMLAPNVTYVITTNLNVTKFNTTIACPGWNTSIQRGPTLTGVMLQMSGVGGTVRDCRIDGNGVVNTNSTIAADLAFSGVGGGSFHNTFINSRARSLTLAGNSEWAKDNQIVGMGPSDPTLQTYGIWAIGNNAGIVIQNNQISNTGIDAIGVNGIGTVVANNHVVNCHCLSAGPLNTGGGQIATYQSPAFTINAATWASTSGGQVTLGTTAAHGVVAGGEFIVSGMTPAAWNGVYIAVSAPTGTSLVAASVNNPGTATAMGTLTADKSTSIVITGNTIDQGCSPNSGGIEIDSRHTTVSNNTVRNQKSFSVGFDAHAAYVDLIGNHISNGNQAAIFYPPFGDVIIKSNVKHITITGGAYTDDQLTHTSPYAITINAGADYITINNTDSTGHVFGIVHNESNGQNIKYERSNMTDYVTATPVAGRLYAEPYWLSAIGGGLSTITKLSATIAGTTGGVARFGIYGDNQTGSPSSPNNKLYDSGLLNISSTGTLSTGTISVTPGCATVDSGCYVWVVTAWSASSTPSVVSMPVVPGHIGYRGQYSTSYSDTTLNTALPNLFGTVAFDTVPVPVLSINDGGIGVISPLPITATVPNLHPGYVTNYWYSPFAYAPNATTPGTPGANVIVCAYGYIFRPITINSIGSRVTTLAAGGNVQFAIYNTGSWGRPANPIVSTGNISTATAGVVNGAVSASLDPGNYFFCQNMDNATSIMQAQASTTVTFPTFFLGNIGQGSAGSGPAAAVPGFQIAQPFGTWPSFSSNTTWVDISTVSSPYIGFKVASSP